VIAHLSRLEVDNEAELRNPSTNSKAKQIWHELDGQADNKNGRKQIKTGLTKVDGINEHIYTIYTMYKSCTTYNLK
jgi:hypothetical protein